MSQPKFILCPYCGHVQTPRPRCAECGGHFEPLSRMATQIEMGPWMVRDPRRPFQPGCSYATMLRLIALGKVTKQTIVRGPTTQQFWSIARHTRGLAHHLGVCHACTGKVSADHTNCPHCLTPFDYTEERDRLGLTYPTATAARAAAARLDRARQQPTGKATDELLAEERDTAPQTLSERPNESPPHEDEEKPKRRGSPVVMFLLAGLAGLAAAVTILLLTRGASQPLPGPSQSPPMVVGQLPPLDPPPAPAPLTPAPVPPSALDSAPPAPVPVIDDAWQRSIELERAGRYEQAITLLMTLDEPARARHGSAEVDWTLRRLQAKAAQRELTPFFANP